MHSEDVIVSFRLHHNNESEKAREALMGVINDRIVGHTDDIDLNGVDALVTYADIVKEDWTLLADAAPEEGRKIEVCFLRKPKRPGEPSEWIHNIRSTPDNLYRGLNWHWRYTYPPEVEG